MLGLWIEGLVEFSILPSTVTSLGIDVGQAG